MRGALSMLVVASLAGCGALGTGVEQTAPATATREIDVKRALIESGTVGAAAIRVSSGEDGTVTLDGFVGSEEERAEALRLAREALGGQEPIDALEVR